MPNTGVEAIQTIPLSISKKDIQRFLGKINFLRRFVPNYDEIMRSITYVLKKNAEMKRDKEARDAFARIKEALQEAPILISPDYQKSFHVFSFASPTTIDVVLLQKNEDNKEKPVALFNKVLRDSELKYNILDIL